MFFAYRVPFLLFFSSLTAYATTAERSMVVMSSTLAATTASLAAAQSSLAAATASQITAMNASISTVAAASTGMMIGYKECQVGNTNNADSNRVVMRCSYNKQR